MIRKGSNGQTASGIQARPPTSASAQLPTPPPGEFANAQKLAPNDKAGFESQEALARLNDEVIKRYWQYFTDRETQERIIAEAAKLVRQLDRRHHCGSADFKHEVRDLIHQSWVIQLSVREIHTDSQAFRDAFCATMRNYCRNRRRRIAGKTFLDGNEAYASISTQSATILAFPSPEKVAADRNEFDVLARAIKKRSPDLEPLFLAFADGITVARDQAAYLNLPVTVIYQLRQKLKQFASTTLDR